MQRVRHSAKRLLLMNISGDGRGGAPASRSWGVGTHWCEYKILLLLLYDDDDSDSAPSLVHRLTMFMASSTFWSSGLHNSSTVSFSKAPSVAYLMIRIRAARKNGVKWVFCWMMGIRLTS